VVILSWLKSYLSVSDQIGDFIADDTHIYISLYIPNTKCSQQQLRNVLDDIFHGLNESRSTLNEDKTVFLLIDTHRQREKN